MSVMDWLFLSITVSRRLTNAYYIIMIIITLIAVIIAHKMRFKRFSFYLWIVAGFICFFWEIYLFITGARQYNFTPILELPYHALTEAGPGLIIMILFAHKIRLIDISDYSDDYTDANEGTNKKIEHIKNKNKQAKKKDVAFPKDDSEDEDYEEEIHDHDIDNNIENDIDTYNEE